MKRRRIGDAGRREREKERRGVRNEAERKRKREKRGRRKKERGINPEKKWSAQIV